MEKFYPIFLGKLCLTLLFTFLIADRACAQIVTYDTTFDGWNAIVTEDLSLHGNDSAAGIIFFPGIDQQTRNINDLTVNGPHYLIKNGMWDGSVKLGNGVHHPFIISLQPPAPGYPATVVKPKIDEILARYRIKRNSLYFTGLSMGAWQANLFLTYEAAPGDHSYGNMVRAMVNLEGVEPSDYTGMYSSMQYPGKMGHWAKACGGRELWVEGSQDWRDMLAGAQNMIDSVPGSATYFMVTYGGGAHCCWNTEYEPSVTWTKASNPNISKLVGTPVPMNVWQWMLRQGDTSLPGGSAAVVAVAPTANAGTAQTITLPTNSVNLTGSGTGNNGAKVSTMSWAQSSGPNNAKIKPGSLGTATGATMDLGATASGLIAGNYTFQLTVKDNDGMVSTSSVTVTVNAAPAPPPPPPPSAAPSSATPPSAPNVSAGGDPTITLPVTTVTLKGTAAGSNGAKITAALWQQTQGPVKGKIASPSDLSTAITGLTAAGTYVFRLTVADKSGKQAAATVDVVVKPAVVTKTPPTVSAGKGQKITLPTSSTTLDGSAAGTNGAKIVTISWAQLAGPEKAKITSPASLTTAVSGMTEAGDYIFELIAIDNNGKSSNGSMTVTVEPDVTKAPPTVSAGPNLTVTLPTNSATLKGSATGHNGAVVNSYFWMFVTGPAWVKFSNEWAPTTTVSGLAAGTYVFELSASDNNDETSTSTMTLIVKPEPSGASTNTTAVTGNAAAVTDPAVQDSIDRAGGLVIFPNPANDLLNLRLADKTTGKMLIRIFDANGRIVQASTLEKDATSVESAIDVSKLNKGVYVLEMMTASGGITTRKFVKL
jgi:hypothetical protein